MREYNEIDDIINLGLRYPKSEFAIQAHPTKFSGNMPRYIWFDTLMNAAKDKPINLAMHINAEYRNQICRGIIPQNVLRMWNMCNNDNTPIIKRVQININGGNQSSVFYSRHLADIIRSFPNIEFIFQYAPKQRRRIQHLDNRDVKVSLLYDESGGRGEAPRVWREPAFENHKMGYSGGFGPDNVTTNLYIMNRLLPKNYTTWIDAEGKLRNPDTKQFDCARAEQYIKNALAWQK